MKILASDFDNTIYYLDDEEKNLENAKAIQEFVHQGNCFCIITGRNYTDIKKLLNQYQIPYHYLVCEDGAKIFNGSDQCLDTVYLKKEILEEVTSLLDQKNCTYYLDDGYQKIFYPQDCVKVVVECTNDLEKEEIVSYIQKQVNVHIYASRFHVNIIDSSVNKENALKKLISLENLDEKSLYVIGDNDNDYEMLKHFQGAIMKRHHAMLDDLKKKEFDTLKDYIEELMKN